MDYLRFNCGARLPETGYLAEPWEGHGRPRKDGRTRLIVYNSARLDEMTQPTLGRKGAPCRWDCPCKRSSGRRKVATWDPVCIIITCYPEVVHEEGTNGRESAQ